MQISKWGNRLAVRLPKALVEELALTSGDELQVVSATTKRITIAGDERRALAVDRMRARLAHTRRLRVRPGRGPRPVTAFLDTKVLIYAQGTGAKSSSDGARRS